MSSYQHPNANNQQNRPQQTPYSNVSQEQPQKQQQFQPPSQPTYQNASTHYQQFGVSQAAPPSKPFEGNAERFNSQNVSNAPFSAPQLPQHQFQAHIPSNASYYAPTQSSFNSGAQPTDPNTHSHSNSYPASYAYQPGQAGLPSAQQNGSYAQANNTPPYIQPQYSNGPQMAPQFNQQIRRGFGHDPSATGHSHSAIVNLIGTAPNLQGFSKGLLPKSKSSCDPSFMSCTLNCVPNSQSLLSKSKVPFGLLISPHSLQHESNVPLICGPIVRCRRCRTYINPFVEFVAQSTRFKCNICSLENDIPPDFDFDIRTKQPIDRMTRPELTSCVVEYEASPEYMVRPPQPAVFTFLIDVSSASLSNGVVSVASRTIIDTLAAIPNANQRAKVSLIAYDEAIHYFAFIPGADEPEMCSVTDLKETFLPCPAEFLLVNLAENITALEGLLAKLPSLFAPSPVLSNNLGSALKAACSLLSSVGGKIIVIQGSLPNENDGALKVRDDPLALGTPKESILLQPSTLFYKNLAVECTRTQIGIDMFLLPQSNYIDVATLSNAATYTGGHVFYYPAFKSSSIEDCTRFANDLSSFLSRPFGLEAVLRIRATRGLTLSPYYGNFFMRSPDLLSLPNVNFSHSYAVEVQYDESIITPFISFQSALLYTSSEGDRRIRVSTISIPVTEHISTVISHVSQSTLACLLAKIAVEKVFSSKLEDARDYLMNKCIDILNAAKNAHPGNSNSSQLAVNENLALFPLLVVGMLKSKAFKPGMNTTLDDRAYALMTIRSSSLAQCMTIFYPKMFRVDLPHADEGNLSPGETPLLPLPINLTSERLVSNRNAIFLLYNGFDVFFWIGSEANAECLQSIFAKSNVSDFPSFSKLNFTDLRNDSEGGVRVCNIIRNVTKQNSQHHPAIYIFKEDSDPQTRLLFLNQLVEDRTENYFSYAQFLLHLKEKIFPN